MIKYKLLIRSPQEINVVKKTIYENILPKLYKPQAKKKKGWEKEIYYVHKSWTER